MYYYCYGNESNGLKKKKLLLQKSCKNIGVVVYIMIIKLKYYSTLTLNDR